MSTNDKLNKGFQNIAQTSDARSNSEELLSRFTSVPAEKSLQAAKVVGDLKGSWIQSSSISNQVSEGLYTGKHNPESTRYFSIGQPNFPEINFRPYDYGTNRCGDKSPSLLGHPISFEVIGPTVRTPSLNFQWLVTDNSLTSDGDILTIDPQSIFSPPAGPADTSTTSTIASTYGFSDLTAFDGGLYLIVAQTGEQGSYEGSPGGLPDGYIYDLTGNYVPIAVNNSQSKFEIFRVIDVGSDYLELSPNKRLSSYFTITSAPSIPVLRAVTLIQPRVARLAAIPSSEGSRGREAVFAVLPPETSLNSDFMPAYDGGTPGDGTWLQGTFETYGTSSSGDSLLYNENVLLPSNKVLEEVEGSLFEDGDVLIPTLDIGMWSVKINPEYVKVSHIGKILKISEIIKTTSKPSVETMVLNSLPRGTYDSDALVGFFEIVDVDTDDDFYTLKRICEFNPITGKLNFGDPTGLLLPTLGIFTSDFKFKGQILESIYNLHRSPQLDLEGLRVSVLHTLIDPAWVNPQKQPSFGNGEGYSVFNTKDSENPGNLLELGFKPVLYPAKAGSSPGDIIPDWDNPIKEGFVTLNPASSLPQTLQIDYSSGLVYLSESPVPGSGCSIAPNGIIASASNNPRNEIILFISCVPFSRDTLKTGTGISTTIEPYKGVVSSVLGKKNIYPIKAHVDGTLVDPADFSGLNTEVPLAIAHNEDDLPESGKFYYTSDRIPFSHRSSDTKNKIFGYYGKRFDTDALTGREYVTLRGVYGESASSFTPLDPFQDGNLNIVPIKNFPDRAQDDGPYLSLLALDNSYGSQYRTFSNHIKGISSDKTNDGAIELSFPVFEGHTDILSHFQNFTYISGGDLGSATDLFVQMSAVNGSIGGEKFTIPAAELVLEDDSVNYISIPNFKTEVNQKYPKLTVSASQISITDCVYLYAITTAAGSITFTTDLRNTVKDINLKVEVFVGETDGNKIGSFLTVGEATKYIGAISETDSNVYKIIVKGITIETETINIPRNGLIIEGVSLNPNGATPIAGMSWNFESGCLIDFNGKTDCIFRDIQFTLDPTDLSASATLGDMVVFKGSGSRINIENCNFYGSDIASNFIIFDEVYDSLVQNCHITAVSRAGIRNNNNFSCSRITIRNCIISQGAYEPPLTITSAISFSGNLVPLRLTSLINIENCKVSGYTRGIYLDSFGSVLKNNHIDNTLLEGIICTYIASDAYNTIEGNYLSNISTNALPERIAIECFKNGNVVSNNHIAFYDPSSTPFRTGISVSSSVSTKINNNKADGAILLEASATQTLVYANECLALNIMGDDNSILGNYLTEVFAFSSSTGTLVIEGANNSVSSNICEADVYIHGNGNSFTSNIIGNASTASSLRISSDYNSIVGNRISQSLILSDEAASNMVTGNYVRGGGAGLGIVIAANCSYNTFTGNYIADGIIDCSGPYSIINANEIKDLGFGGDIFLQTGSVASIVSNNFVWGDVNVYDDQTSVSNNWLLGFIRMDGIGYIIVGNNTSNILSTAGTDPDASGIVVANRIVTGTIFGVAVAGSAKDNNV